MKATFTAIVWTFGCLSLATAADWHVHVSQGNDQHSGSEAEPLATLQQAVMRAQAGDTIRLAPAGAVFRQSVTFVNKVGITLEGNGCTLDGSDPLPADGWEEQGENLWRRRLPLTPYDRHLLFVDGKLQRMGRSASKLPDFPSPAELQPGEYCFEKIDDQTGWLYVAGAVDKLEWSVRANGYATGSDGDRLVVRNLNTRRFLNDGFNIHGRIAFLQAEQVTGYDCFDEGFSAHDTCRCEITHGKFWGNDNAIADVNDCITTYRHCEFRDSVSCEVLLRGRQHRLEDCLIQNRTSATALSGSPSAPMASFQLDLLRVKIAGSRPDNSLSRVRINGGQATIRASEFRHTAFNTLGARVEATDFTLPDSEWVRDE
ncbi:hypothetical protein [Lignipirellula cremea]|uniref:Right handed beta helix domain-containing protein n=1 Tax=Lignipirellula cremea TaxID=2528010 RepID=A0A518DNP0_9BACT|nr:hypothetical protein [Lignipirellula cremea]QDU93452.1 hypothetical protein Pla8534_12320 [Lignipirellula cremea]